jgi:branched-chain amino acid transport system ATP-binding protein
MALASGSLPRVESRELPPNGLSVRDLTVRFGGITALENVALSVRPGEVLGVIGPNGAGKTTLFNAICGFVGPESGTIEWCGSSLRRIRPDQLAEMGIARTLQGVALFHRLTVIENVMTGAQRFRRAGLFSALLGLPWSDRDELAVRDRALGALARLGCDGLADRLPSTLPFAVQKKVAIARAIAAEPRLLMLDEPAGGLDSTELAELAQLIRDLGSSIAVMLVEHHMDLVMSVCDRVVVLDFGRVIAAGAPAEVRTDPDVLDAYLGRDVDAEPANAGARDARG